MKKLFYIFILIVGFLFACKNSYTEVIQSLHADGSKQIVYFYDIQGTDSTLVKMQEFYPSSQNKRIEGFFKNNQRDGLWKSWRQDGKLWSEGEFKNGLHHGITKVYHENGQLYYSGTFQNDQRSGIWKFYDETGKLVKEVDYNLAN